MPPTAADAAAEVAVEAVVVAADAGAVAVVDAEVNEPMVHIKAVVAIMIIQLIRSTRFVFCVLKRMYILMTANLFAVLYFKKKKPQSIARDMWRTLT
jgi:hypothetical protein